MNGKYRKYQVEMSGFNSDYRLWKAGFDSIFCQLESYKEKRSVYLAVKNLYPSKDLYYEKKQIYKTLLIGECDGSIIHQEFEGPFVDRKGEGSFYKKFTGDDIEKYQWCILMAVNEENGDSTEISKGATPYFKELSDCTEEGEVCEPFSDERDETKARWYKFSDWQNRAGNLPGCEYNLKKYGHYIKGKGRGKTFIGIPGRFLMKEKPGGERGNFLLWQPIRGGEEFFDNPENMTPLQQERIFGYWIALFDEKKGLIYPF